ncbi:hypothetical protein Agub_g4981, partial [Astrephomene gubernaculifera]
MLLSVIPFWVVEPMLMDYAKPASKRIGDTRHCQVAPSAVRLHVCTYNQYNCRASFRPAAHRPESSAEGFIAEYDLAGIQLEPRARAQLRAWYLEELRRGPEACGHGIDSSAAAASSSSPSSTASKDLPPLPRTRPGKPRLTLLWDLESVRPFTQQQQPPLLNPLSFPAPGNSADRQQQQSHPQQQEQQPASSSASRARGPSRLAAAGLAGADLIGALDRLCLTLQQYGSLHAVHLLAREASLRKSPALRRQVAQLRTWVVGPHEEAAEEEEHEKEHEREGMSQQRQPQPQQQRQSQLKSESDLVHDCPMCRSAYSSRRALLRHFTAVHQAPLLAATASDPRVFIMWTRGRPVSLPLPCAPLGDEQGAGRRGREAEGPGRALEGRGAAGATVTGGGAVRGVLQEDSEEGEVGPDQEPRVRVSPQEFVFAREQLMRGRHLEPLLTTAALAAAAAAPATTTTTTTTPVLTITTLTNSNERQRQPPGTWAAQGRPRSSSTTTTSSSSSSEVLAP